MINDCGICIKADGEDVRVATGTFQVHDWNVRRYTISSMQSLIDLVKAKGSQEKTVISYDARFVQVIFDDTVMDRPLDTAEYNFKHSDELIEWMQVLGNNLTQKRIVDFLNRRPEGEVDNVDSLIANIRQMKLATEIVGDYQYDDNNNVSFFFKTKDGEGCLKLPSEINVHLSLLNGSDYIANIEVELELNKPKTENEKPTIAMYCPKFERYMKRAIDHEVGMMQQELEEYLILAGRIL